MHNDARGPHTLPVLRKASTVITVRRASEVGLVGLQCGDEVKCADCGYGMKGLVWFAERLVGMHHSEPVVELLCLPCAKLAKSKLVNEGKKKK